ncbi:hypothetical protein A7U60_g516 [Sanghuangporus baumii]|nr:hypothetical protein A7U60_g516 [Sanghuangporus baumii]
MLDAQVKTGQDWSDPKHPEEPIKLTVKLLNTAKEYFVTSRGCYEEQQWYEIRVFFEWIFGKKAWRSDTVWGNYAILVCKNATGLDGDASLEAAVWYGKNCHRMKEVHNIISSRFSNADTEFGQGIYKHSKLPVIIVGVMGNVLEISIGVCLEEVVVDKILHFEVLDSPNRNETVVKLALIASALETCADELRDEYRDLERTSEPVEEETWHLPCPSATAFSPNSLIPELEFKAKLSRRNEKLTKLKGENAEMRSLFLATYCGRGVIVKFAVTYNDSAHTAVADQNHAPRLHTCEQVIGGLKMVVMERVHGKRMCDEDGNSLPRNVFEDLGKALRIIHDKDLVFGDLRDTNVMITKSDVKVEAKLIDFDWVDKDGKGRYPPLINTELTKKELSPEVGPWRFMHKSHDNYSLSKLISKYCNDPVYINTKCEELMR